MINSQKSYAVRDEDNNPQLHQGKDIDRLIYSFKCKGEDLHFFIKIQMKNSNRLVCVLETKDRIEFKTMFDYFVNIRHEDRTFYLPA